MIKYSSKFEIKEEKQLVEVECDNCGRSYKAADVFEIDEFVFIRKIGGYGSIIGDGEIVELDFCQYCFENLFNKVYRKVGRSW